MQPDTGVPPLVLTGERTLPGIAHERYWFARHLVAYRFAAPRCAGLRVVDAGCGEGYGTALLAATAASAVGVDLAPEVVAHARAAYPRARFVEADLAHLPLARASADAVVSLQVIEHLADVDAFLAEVARVLRPGGRFLCATPNRLTFTPGSEVPVNPFHLQEYAPAEFAAALHPRFRVEALLGVHHGSRLRALELVARRSVPDLVLARPPEHWPRWLSRVVSAVRPSDFRLRVGALDRSLDLLAVATARA